LTGAGSLIMIQLETLQMCASDISITPETFTLGVLNSQGMAFNLPGVEYRDMVVHLAPANGQAVVTPQAAAGAAPAASVGLTPPSGPAFFGLGENGIWLIIGAVGLLFVLIVGVIVFLYLRGRKTPASSQNTTPILGPALIHKGGTVTLPQKRTQLGRHIEIVYNNGGFFMVDSGSRLGVYINGKRLGNGSYPLSHGDRVQLGQEISYQFIHTRVNSAQRG
jgi:hypothetical protein